MSKKKTIREMDKMGYSLRPGFSIVRNHNGGIWEGRSSEKNSTLRPGEKGRDTLSGRGEEDVWFFIGPHSVLGSKGKFVFLSRLEGNHRGDGRLRMRRERWGVGKRWEKPCYRRLVGVERGGLLRRTAAKQKGGSIVGSKTWYFRKRKKG